MYVSIVWSDYVYDHIKYLHVHAIWFFASIFNTLEFFCLNFFLSSSTTVIEGVLLWLHVHLERPKLLYMKNTVKIKWHYVSEFIEKSLRTR
jgi:hypothetical protein